MYDNCNEYIFWIGANEAASIQAFHRFVFREISKFITLQRSGLKNHPFMCQATGDAYCLTTFHHLSIHEYTNITDHLTEVFSGLPGMGHNNWSHAVAAPLGCLIKVIGAGVGIAHAETEHMAIGIFKYPWWIQLTHWVFLTLPLRISLSKNLWKFWCACVHISLRLGICWVISSSFFKISGSNRLLKTGNSSHQKTKAASLT